MSRIGKLPVEIPENVEVSIEGQRITVKWPKWELTYTYRNEVNVEKSENQILVTIDNYSYNNFWGLTRAIINNMVTGVTEGFTKRLQVLWVGYNAQVSWNNLVLNLGYSHPVEYPIPEDIQISVDKDSKWNPLIIVSGMEKQKVWEVAAEIRAKRPPEPYKWKWIRYEGEKVKQKEWKAWSK